jgi:EpsI family protein
MSQPMQRRALVILGLSAGSLGAAEAMKPRTKLASIRGLDINIDAMVPRQFDGWQALDDKFSAVVNPVVQETLDKIYSQLVSRTYVSAGQRRIMLSIAYGDDQRKYLGVHYPEVCYPAQGFAVQSNVMGQTTIAGAPLPLRRLETSLGKQRYEPVTYWTTMGDFTSFGGFPRRMIELRYGLQRVIPDGLLFRVSSIGQDSAAQFKMQEQFIQSMLEGMQPPVRRFFTGQLSE